jgi:hypothetical protein
MLLEDYVRQIRDKQVEDSLPRSMGVRAASSQPVIRYFAVDGVAALGSLAATSASE